MTLTPEPDDNPTVRAAQLYVQREARLHPGGILVFHPHHRYADQYQQLAQRYGLRVRHDSTLPLTRIFCQPATQTLRCPHCDGALSLGPATAPEDQS